MGYTVKTTIKVSYSADEWQLYSGMTGVSRAANRLNKAANIALSQPTVQEADKVWRKASSAEAEFGAADSEPEWEFEKLAFAVYGDEARRWYG